MNKKQLLDYLSKEIRETQDLKRTLCGLGSRKILRKDLQKYTKHLKDSATSTERIYCLLNKINKYTECTVCNKEITSFQGYEKGYAIYCSIKCNNNSPSRTGVKRKQFNYTKREYKSFNGEVSVKELLNYLSTYNQEDYNKFCQGLGLARYESTYKITDILKYYTDSLPEDSRSMERLYWIKNSLSDYDVLCSHCNNSVKQFDTVTNSYKKYCCPTCYYEGENVLDKRRTTFLNKYGVDNPFKSEEVKQNIRKTNLEKGGHVSNLHWHGVQDELRKKWSEEEGREINNPSELIRSKVNCKKTKKERYGDENYNNIEQGKETQLKKFFKHLLTSDRLRQLSIPLFGEEDYKGAHHKYSFSCLYCNKKFTSSLINGSIPLCPICYPPLANNTSKGEKEVYNFCKSVYKGVIIENDKKVLEGLEIDIYIPDLKLGIEYDGLYWHSECGGFGNTKESMLNKRTIHLRKTDKALEKDVQLIHIFEDEWILQKDIIKSILKAKMGLLSNKVFARKCEIKNVTSSDASDFLNNNHLQGNIRGKHIGLYFDDELLSIFTYGKSRFDKKYGYEIYRFCNKIEYNIVGGFSKLVSYFVKNVSPSLISSVDRRYGTGNSYIKCGFTFIGKTGASYFYIGKGHKRLNRLGFQKHMLKDKLETFDPNLTEWENMQFNGYDRIWDCGTFKYAYE